MISDKAVEAAARKGLGWDTPDHEDLVQNVKAGICSEYMADRWRIATASARAALPVLLEGKAEEIAAIIDPLPWSDDWTNYPRLRGERKVYSLTKANRIISILTGESDER